MRWRCPNCKIVVSVPDDFTKIRCSCGNVARQGQVYPQSSPVGFEEDSRPIRTPDWEITARLKSCRGCIHFNDKTKRRCALIDLGCSETFRTTISDTSGKCPLGNWSEYRIPWYGTQDLLRNTLQLIPQLPKDIDAIIGIPRSGLIPAATIATILHKPLYTISNGEIIQVNGGNRSHYLKHNGGRFAVVEDSIGSGMQFNLLRNQQIIPPNAYKIAIFVTPMGAQQADYYQKIQGGIHLFEWNFWNGPQMGLCAIDLDGLLSPDVPPNLWDSGELEEAYFQQVQPLSIPQNPFYIVPAIVTARLEKFRKVTEDWLKRHKVQYHQLIMWDFPEERTIQRVASWKRNVCRMLNVSFYVESDPYITRELRKRNLRVLDITEGFLR